MSGFLFTPGEWLGEGTIQIGMVKEKIKFFTRWIISSKEEETVAIQEVELQGSSRITNRYEVITEEGSAFQIKMSSESIPLARGVGIKEERKIAWEFSDGEPLQGFEIYELINEERYFFRAQFLSEEIYGTRAEGEIWRVK